MAEILDGKTDISAICEVGHIVMMIGQLTGLTNQHRNVTLTHFCPPLRFQNQFIIVIMVLFYLFIQYYAVLKEISIR